MAEELRTISCNTATFLGMKLKLIPLWDRQQDIWKDVIEKLPLRKLKHCKQSEYYNEDRPVCKLLETHAGQRSSAWGDIQKCFMPLPSTVMLFPEFR